MRFPSSFALVAWAALISLPTTVTAQTGAPRFEKTTCDFPLPAAYPGDLVRECGWLTVPESRARPAGRSYRLFVLKYLAQQPDGSPPLLLLHGGPGGAGGTHFPWGELLLPVTRKRDVITFDMRGVAASEPRYCPNFDAEGSAAFNLPDRRAWKGAFQEAVRRCVASMDSAGIDRTAFGADVNAADAVDLRRALNIGKWDIYGVSYGGVVAQELLRHDAGATRSAALISTVSPGADYDGAFFLSYQRNLDRVFAQCRSQPACAAAFPNLQADFDSLYAELSAHPLEVPVQNAVPARNVVLDGSRFVFELRREFRNPLAIARLPLFIDELRRGDRNTALQRLVGNGVVPSWGPEGPVVQCNEYGADRDRAVAARLPLMRAPFREMTEVFDFRSDCSTWFPKLVSRADLRPIVSAVPTLIVHGEYDPMDIPATQQRIAGQLANAYRFTFPGETHANPPIGCHGIIVQEFLENPMRAPDASCIERMPGIRFKTDRLQPTITFVITPRGGARTPFAGTWEAVLTGRNPDWTLQLETDGRAVRGVVAERTTVVDGSIAGDTLRLQFKSPDGARAITLTGTVQGDELRFTRSVEITPDGASSGPGLMGGESLRTIIARRLPSRK